MQLDMYHTKSLPSQQQQLGESGDIGSSSGTTGDALFMYRHYISIWRHSVRDLEFKKFAFLVKLFSIGSFFTEI